MAYRKHEPHYVVEWSKGWVHVARVTAGDVPAVAVMGAVRMQGLSDDKVVAALKGLFKGISAAARKLVLIPRSDVIIRYLNLPSENDAEIRNMVALQLERHLPYSAREMYFDFSRFQTDQKGYSHVVLAALSKREGDRILTILKKSGFVPDAISVSSWSLAAYCLNGHLSEYSAAGDIYVIDMQRPHVEILVLRGRTLVFTRTFMYKGDITVPENHAEFVKNLMNEIAQTREMITKEHGERPMRAVILDGYIGSMCNPLQAAVGEHTAVAANQPPRVAQDKTTRDILDTMLLSSSVLAGVPMLSEYPMVNLLPDTLKRESMSRKTHGSRLVATVLSCAVIAVIILTAGAHFINRWTSVQSIESQLMEIDPHTQKITSVVRKINTIQKIKYDQVLPLDIIVALYELIPAQMYITGFEYDVAEGVTIRGAAGTVGQVSDVLLILQESPYFSNAEIKFAKQRTSRGTSFVDFEISSYFNNGSSR